MVIVMESPTSLLYHTFCLKCDQRDFHATEINENIVIDYSAGDVICGKCGEVLLDHLINSGSEVVSYQEDFENGTAKEMRSSGKSDYYGSSETIFVQGPENLRQALERAQKTIITRKEKVILGNIHLVGELCAKMNLTSAIKAKAVDIFTSTLTASSTITKVDLIVAVSVYLACRVEGYPRLLDEVGQASGIDPKEIRKIQGPVARKLSLSIGVIKPSDVCNRMAVQLCFSFHQRQFVYEFCQEIAKYELFDTSPPQLVVAGVLAWTTVLTRPSISNNSNDISTSSNSLLSIHELCRVCFVPVGAVNKMFLELYEYLPVIAPSELSSLIQEVHPRLSSRLEKYLMTQCDNASDVVIVHYEASKGSSNERKNDSSQKKKRKIGEV